MKTKPPRTMRQLLAAEYIPFGTQYYRAPSPDSREWERDLKNIAGLGFNTVKFWIQWRWNHPAPKRYDFNDIDRLMDLAQHSNLRVMLNTIFDAAPAWIYRMYPDASMVTLDGRPVGPQTQPHRQIGGLGLCYNHPKAMKHLFDFLQTAVRRYAKHPALAMWNVGSEPELTSSMAELRLYAEDAAAMGDMLCYCSNCQRAFRNWLKKKYGHVDELNRSWNRRYRTFAEAEIPRTRNTFNDMIDWRMFFVHTLGEHIGRRFTIAETVDQGRHPLLCHHVFIQGFPVTSTASDPWNVGRFGDLHGFTQMDDPMMADVLRSCARGKPVISAEMLMLFGYTLDLPAPVTQNDVKRFVFTGIAANLKGFLFWQYRPETLGREAPTWGLTALDGSPTPWLKSFAEVNAVIQKNSAFLLDAQPAPAEVALLYSPENQIFAWEATGSEKSATDSLLGMHRALYEHNITMDFLHPRELTEDLLTRYKVICVPFPYCLSRHTCDLLAAWVHAGGVLIAEAYCAGWNMEAGSHQTLVPGNGLHEVFGVRQGLVRPASDAQPAEFLLTSDLPTLARGARITGTLAQEDYILDGADTVASWPSGEPAVTSHRYGKGTAIAIGSYVALPFHRGRSAVNGEFLAGLVEHALPRLRPIIGGNRKVRIDLLRAPDGRQMMIARNLEQVPFNGSVRLPAMWSGEWTEQFSGRIVECRNGSVELALAPRDVQVYRG